MCVQVETTPFRYGGFVGMKTRLLGSVDGLVLPMSSDVSHYMKYAQFSMEIILFIFHVGSFFPSEVNGQMVGYGSKGDRIKASRLQSLVG